jgi:hypothetical protein
MVQKHLVQATYWHNPLDEEKYKNKSTFLADINNERIINKTYIERLQSLEKYVRFNRNLLELMRLIFFKICDGEIFQRFHG